MFFFTVIAVDYLLGPVAQKTFQATHPFIFILADKQYGVLFMGKLASF